MSTNLVTAAKARAAAIGATLTALAAAWAVASVALNDGKIQGGEVATLLTTAVTLVGTVYAVWRTPNTPKSV